MAAEVDFGDRELFEQLDADEAAATPGPAAQPLHTRFDEETEELRERLRECQDAVRQLQAENILPGRQAALASGGARGGGGAPLLTGLFPPFSASPQAWASAASCLAAPPPPQLLSAFPAISSSAASFPSRFFPFPSRMSPCFHFPP